MNTEIGKNYASWKIYAAAVAIVSAVVALLLPFRAQLNPTTVSLALLLVVLFAATVFGSRPALVASVVGVLSFNFFFLPPYYTFHIDELENWVAFGAFLITALTAGQLSVYARRRAEESEQRRKEIERLYRELQAAFEQASQAEALRQSEKLKSALLDAVTHDIRTPLTSIKASVTTLLDEQKPRTQNGTSAILNDEMRREMLEIINEETDRLNHFVEGMLELAKIEAGEIEFCRQWDAVDEIINAAIARAEPRLRDHKVRVEIEKDLPVIRVDSRAVAEVIYTLIDNAAKYSPPDSTILIAAKRYQDEQIVVAVEDEGEGIPPNLRERVFDKFFRATRDGDAGGGASPQGSGVGLSIAKGIVEAHDGKIWITDGKKGGARFEFTLPVGDEDEEIEENRQPALPIAESFGDDEKTGEIDLLSRKN